MITVKPAGLKTIGRKYKRIIAAFLTAALSISALSGCNNVSKEEESPLPSPSPTESQAPDDTTVYGKASDYFPFEKQTAYTYTRDDGLEEFSYPIYLNENRMQRITQIDHLLVAEVYEKGEDNISIVYANQIASGFENFLDESQEYIITVLKDPIQLGNSWQTSTGPALTGIASGTSEITGVNVEVTTPFGTYTTIEVSQEMENGYKDVFYYAKDVGLVKQESFMKGIESGSLKSDDKQTTKELKEIKKDAKYPLTFTVYYPDANAENVLNSTVSIEFDTDKDIKTVFETVLKDPVGDPSCRVISDNTKINSITINREQVQTVSGDRTITDEDIIVTLDLSEDFLNDMNAGLSYEELLYDSLTWTFAQFYMADEFVLTVSGEVYEPTH